MNPNTVTPLKVLKYRTYKTIKCDICLYSSLLVKNQAGLNYVCAECLQREEKERADQLLHQEKKQRIYKIKPIITKEPLYDTATIDFTYASQMWRLNKKKVKNSDGMFAYIC